LEVFDYDGNNLRSENTWTEEAGLSTSFSLNIPSKDNPPTDDITIAVTADMPTEVLLSTNKHVFTTSNYNQKQYITITGQDGDVIDGTNMTQLLGARLRSNRLRYFKTPSTPCK
jgi:hypothetical protein